MAAGIATDARETEAARRHQTAGAALREVAEVGPRTVWRREADGVALADVLASHERGDVVGRRPR